jgi:hypothetical protein
MVIPEGVLSVREYSNHFTGRVSEAIVNAWKNRKPGSMTWAFTHAVIGYNRRAVYSDGTAQMYGKTDTPKFMNMEGMEDHDVNILFFWDKRG